MAHEWPDLTPAQRMATLYKRLSWVATATDIISGIASMTKKTVYLVKPGEDEAVPEHDFSARLINPNEVQTGRSLIRQFVADYILCNNAYLWLNIVDGKPREIWRIPMTNIAPKMSETLGVEYYAYDPGDGVLLKIPVEQIIHMSDYDPLKMIYPDSSLTSIMLTAQNDITMQQWSQNTYKGNGRLPGILAFADNIGNDEWDLIGKDIDAASAKNNIMRLRSTGQGAVNWIATSSPPSDMEFYVGRDNSRDEILNRIGPGLVSMLSASSTEANARSGKATLIDLVVYPILLTFYDLLTQKVLWKYYGKEYAIRPEDIRVTDRVLQLSEKKEHANVLTVDEYRKEWGDAPHPDPAVGGQMYKLMTPHPAPQAEQPISEPEKPEPQDEDDEPEDIKLPAETENPLTDITSMQEQAAQKAEIYPAMQEIDKWERVAAKSIKKAIEFVSYNTPQMVADGIRDSLRGGGIDASDVFASARRSLQSQPMVIDALYMAVKTLSNGTD